MTRAELVKLANAEGYSMPDGIRLRGDMIGAIRKLGRAELILPLYLLME